MSEADARDEVRTVIQRHAAELDAEDLRDIATDLESTAEKWGGIDV
ncbi:hypothetical protein ABNG03_00215 [Halorubrum sp. RMP-47]|uniref:Uncharacterized protein n=1 Tax=Halorubrum miltondacostae TaxID=3076378 RepID=A0ABD5M3W0_9EURY